MFCPRCGAEYRPGFTTCADCLVPLVDRLPQEEAPGDRARSSRSLEAHGQAEHDFAPKRPRPDLKLVTVFATGDPALVALAKSFLQSASIEFMTRGEGIQNLFGVGAVAGGFNPITGPVEFLVAADDADDARRLLEDLTAGNVGGEDGAADR
jgi:hypothetical protein